MSDIHHKLFAIFQAEHSEHLQKIRSLLALLDRVDEQGTRADLDEAFRRAHSLKGAARAVDLPSVERLAHRLETLFSRVREGALHLDSNVTQIIHQVLDSSEDCVALFAENRVPSEPAGALQAIEDLLGVAPPAARTGAAKSPPLSAASAEESAPSRTAPATRPIAAREMARVRGEDLDRLVRSTGQLLAESLRQSVVTEEMAKIRREISELEADWDRLRQHSGTPLGRRGEAVGGFEMARSFESAGQKLRSLAKRSRTAALLQQRSAWSLRNLSEQLQQDVWSARMVPAESFFEGLGRMVRDLARDERKQIDFRVEGSDVRADRIVLQAVKDPVMHLLRNSISHGIETPAERSRKGKPPAGTLTLRIQSEQRHLIIGVEDDGRGLDLERIGEVGVGRGLLSEAERSNCSVHDLARMIFQPGFSTATTVTELSGRGMGLSVVYEAVRRLQGDVELKTKQGPGTLIVLSVPLSVSSHRLLMVSCQGQTLGIPTHCIQRLYRVQTKQLETMQGKPMVRVDGLQFPLHSIAHLLGMEDDSRSLEKSVLPVMLLKSGSRRAAVLVDAFLNERDALIQDLGTQSSASGLVAGGVLLENGTVSIALNGMHLLERCSAPDVPALKRALQPIKKPPARILVVDDSITTRSLEKSILEAYGYRVRVAVDGVEALRVLRDERVELVISDIEMPQMDGFGLLEAIKGDQSLRDIPVIIVSSLERAEDQERGLALGADAYIVKRTFDQRELLQTIQQIL